MTRFLIVTTLFLILGSCILEVKSQGDCLDDPTCSSRKTGDQDITGRNKRQSRGNEFSRLKLSSKLENEDSLKKLLQRDFPLESVDYYLSQVKRLIRPQTGQPITGRVRQTGRADSTFIKPAPDSTFIHTESDRNLIKIASDFDWLPVVELANTNPSIEEKKRESVALGVASVQEDTEARKEMPKTIPKDSPSFRHRRGFKKTLNFSVDISKVGLALEEATRIFKNEFNLRTKSVTGLGLLGEVSIPSEKYVNYLQAPYKKGSESSLRGRRGANIKGSKDEVGSKRQKRQTISCPSTDYRSMDGTCNNVDSPFQGAAFQRFIRILPADYFGDNGLRRDVNGNPLPNAREVSLTINVNPTLETKRLSFLHMTYGQFIDHDLTSTPIFGGTPYGPISCCELKNDAQKEKTGCAIIDISPDDPTYSCHGVTCMDFTRSLPAPGSTLDSREQLNQLSSYLDGSGIYGIPEGPIDPLRTFEDGLLKMHLTNEGEELLPQSTDSNDGCNTPENEADEEFCFIAGDGRANEVLPLTFFHTLWAREHNRVAKILKDFGQIDEDEELYQEARRIVVAELQHITYNEFLTTIIPHSLLEDNDMLPLTGNQQASIYQSDQDATIANSFAAAAYRFGHSLVNSHMQTMNKYGTTTSFNLQSLFFNPFLLYQEKAMSDVARGVTGMRSGKPGPHFSKAITDDLFKGSSPVGLDLVALNIQRGRDHGIPGYTKFLGHCINIEPANFDELLAVMSNENKERLEEAYNHVDDIDLFIGGLSEDPVSGGILGPTLTCLILDQFLRLKIGDRFFYEDEDQPKPFTAEQMVELHKVTLAKVLCNNIPELKTVQKYPLRNKAADNPTVLCNTIPQYELEPWA